jgi:hypothetical protein
MGRLVVGRVLPGHRLAVLGIVHPGVHAVIGGVIGREDHQALIVGVAPNGLFTPVAEDIRGQTRIGLGAVVAGRPEVIRGQEPVRPVAVPLVDDGVVQYLAL